MRRIKIHIGRRLSEDIDRLAREKGVSRSEYARDALRRYVGVIRFRELQAETIKHVEALRIHLDDVGR